MEPTKRDQRRRAAWCAAALVAGSWTAVAQAQNATWTGQNGGSFNQSNNWSPGTVPQGTAFFDNTAQTTSITVGAGTTIGSFNFNANAPAFSYTFTGGGADTFNGAGVVNASSNASSFTFFGGAFVSFTNGSSAGNAAVAVNQGGAATFTNSATAGSASILTNLGGNTQFLLSSTAGTAHLTGNNSGSIDFFNQSSAGQATIGFTGPNGGFLQFHDTSTAGNATITSNSFGHVKFFNTSTAGNATIVSNSGGDIIFQNSSTAGNATITVNPGGNAEFFDTSQGGTARIINNGVVDFSFDAPPGGITVGSIEGSGGFIIGGNQLIVGANNLSTTMSGALDDLGLGGSLVKVGTGTLILSGNNVYGGGTTVSAGVLQGNTNGLQGNILNNAVVTFDQATDGTYFGVMSGSGQLIKQNAGTLTLTSVNTYSGGTTVTGGLINFSAANNLGSGPITLNGGGLQWATGNTTDISAQLAPLGPGGGTIDTNGNDVAFANGLAGTGGLIKQGAGTFTLNGASSYSGGTIVLGGTLAGDTTSLQGTIVNNAIVLFNQTANGAFNGSMSGTGSLIKQGGGMLTLSAANSYSGGTTVAGGLINFNAANNFGSGPITLNGGGLQWAAGSTADISSQLAPLGAGGGTLDTNGNNVILASAITGSGGLTKQGAGNLNLTGNSTYTGGTAVLAGTLSVNGSIAGNVAVSPAATLGGIGTIGGNVAMAGTLAPGNSIGLLTVNGNYMQMAGSAYQVQLNAAGQNDRINVGGAAAIQGGTVQVQAAAGSYANSTTYTIVRATGGVSGTYSGVTSNFAFLAPTLSYDANDVYLTLALQSQNAFTPTFLALTPNQKAVGVALNQSFANAAGDFATVIGALAALNTAQGPMALDTISGQPYADFGTMNTNNAAMFMNALGQQMANARGSSASTGQRQALAQACEIESCDGTGPLSAWAGALGGLGSVLGDGNASTLTYNFGGGAAGIDYRFDPRFLVGIGTGYTHGTEWVNSFMGQGWSDSVSVAAYGSFTQAGFYVDALAGYAYFNNQLQRQILIPGLQQRTATGSTGANQFLGQAEGGYKLGVYAPADATITPFGRLQISSVTQNAFSESGAQSLSLNVAQQTTNSLRTTIGADFASAIALGNERKLDLAVRLGWLHEFADTSRPITAAFAGAPGNSFTVFGATPARDSAIVGLQATTTVAAATQIYLRYDGGVGGGTDNHSLMAGLRMSW